MVNLVIAVDLNVDLRSNGDIEDKLERTVFLQILLNLGSIWIVRLGLARVLVGPLGLQGVWIAMAVELCVRGLLMLFRLRTTKHYSLARPQEEAA